MSTLRQLREEAGWTAFELAGQAGVSLSTINRMDSADPDKKPVSRLIAYKVLNALSGRLGRRITLEEVENLKIQ